MKLFEGIGIGLLLDEIMLSATDYCVFSCFNATV